MPLPCRQLLASLQTQNDWVPLPGNTESRSLGCPAFRLEGRRSCCPGQSGYRSTWGELTRQDDTFHPGDDHPSRARNRRVMVYPATPSPAQRFTLR